MNDALCFDNVTFGYPGRPIFHELTLRIPQGQFAVLIGPNGGGKSTLLKLVLGFLQPQAGQISVLGNTPGTNQPVGYVPQDVTATEELPLSLFSVALMGRLTPRTGRWTAQDREAAYEALEMMGLADQARRSFRQLSIGQRQRGLIARALASKPALLLLDEPLSSVDPGGRERIMECLREAGKQASVVMVSHDLTVIPDCATSVVFINGDAELYQSHHLTDTLLARLHRRTCRLCSDLTAELKERGDGHV